MVVLILACSREIHGSRLSTSSLSFSVTVNTKWRKKPIAAEKDVAVDFEEDIELPHIQRAYQAIARSKQVVTFRTTNTTVIAHQIDKKARSNLQQAIGCLPLYILNSPSQNDLSSVRHHVLLTGVAGDCRVTVRFLKQIVLNYTMEFEGAPSGRFIATKLGAFLQQHGTGKGRPLACHCFIISSPEAITSAASESAFDSQQNITACGTAHSVLMDLASSTEGSIYEVNIMGDINKVRGGTAGGVNMKSSKQLLDQLYSANLTVQESKDLIWKVLTAKAHKNGGEKVSFDESSGAENGADELGGGGGGADEVSFQFYTIPDVIA